MLGAPHGKLFQRQQVFRFLDVEYLCKLVLCWFFGRLVAETVWLSHSTSKSWNSSPMDNVFPANCCIRLRTLCFCSAQFILFQPASVPIFVFRTKYFQFLVVVHAYTLCFVFCVDLRMLPGTLLSRPAV